jgi:hypothetical protein
VQDPLPVAHHRELAFVHEGVVGDVHCAHGQHQSKRLGLNAQYIGEEVLIGVAIPSEDRGLKRLHEEDRK